MLLPTRARDGGASAPDAGLWAAGGSKADGGVIVGCGMRPELSCGCVGGQQLVKILWSAEQQVLVAGTVPSENSAPTVWVVRKDATHGSRGGPILSGSL